MREFRVKQTFSILAAGVIMATVPAWAQASAKDEVMKVEQGIAAVSNAEQLEPYYAPDIALYDMIVPGEFHGWKAVHEDFAAQFAAVKNPKVEIINIEAWAQGNVGFAYSTQKFSFDLPNNGQHTQVVFRQTDFLKRIKGKWLVVHQHISVPYDPATGKAQLTPAASKSP